MSTPIRARRSRNHAETDTPPAFPGTSWGEPIGRTFPAAGWSISMTVPGETGEITRNPGNPEGAIHPTALHPPRIKGKMRIQEFPAVTSPFAVGTAGRVSTSWRTDGSRYTQIQRPSRLIYTLSAVIMIPFVPW